MKLFLDIGSSNIKYKTSNNDEVFLIKFPLPLINENNIFEVDAEEIIKIIKDIIDQTKPDSLFISTQMHGYVLLNKGKAVTNYISWRDTRGGTEKPNFVLSNEYGVRIKKNLPRLSIQTQNVEFDEFASLGSYISYVLTGNNASHITDLAASGFYNIVKKMLDIVKFKLPTALYTPKIIGTYKNVKVYCPFGDQQCSVLGLSGKIDFENTLILNIGTASQMCLVSKSFESGNYETRPFFDDMFLLTVTNLPGGAVLHDLEENKALDLITKEEINALKLLPKRNNIILTGGGSKKYKDIFENLFKKLDIKYAFNEELDSLEGLKILSEGEQNMNKVGLMISEIPYHSLPLILKQSGLDFCILDYEHGGFDYESMARIILTSKLSDFNTIVRLANNERKDIIKCLDMGASGLLLPMTNNADDISKVVNFAKYPPLGKRGISTMRAHTLYNPGSITEYIKNANEKVKIFAQIETISGVKNIEEILNVPGVSGIMVGPNDLSADYGCLGDKNAHQILDAIAKIGKACKAVNKDCGIITGNKNYLDCAKANGFNIYCVGSELNAIANYAKQIKKDNE